MDAYDLLLVVPWFHKRNPEIDWGNGRLTAPRSPSASGVEEMTPRTTAVASKVSEAENDKLLGRGQSIPTLGATVFDDLLASKEVVAAYALRIGECTGLLGAGLEDITFDSPGDNSRALDATSRVQRR